MIGTPPPRTALLLTFLTQLLYYLGFARGMRVQARPASHSLTNGLVFGECLRRICPLGRAPRRQHSRILKLWPRHPCQRLTVTWKPWLYETTPQGQVPSSTGTNSQPCLLQRFDLKLQTCLLMFLWVLLVPGYRLKSIARATREMPLPPLCCYLSRNQVTRAATSAGPPSGRLARPSLSAAQPRWVRAGS